VTLGQDGSIAFDLKLTGELSTNLLSPTEEAAGVADFGTIVAPGVNAQLHQHMFCYRLDMAVDGPKNRVVETTVEAIPRSPEANPYGNAFRSVARPLTSERGGVRPVPPRGGAWRIENASGATNAANGRPTAYKLVPNARGSPQPLLLAHPESAVCKRGAWATAALWVTPYSPAERFPAGEFPTQSIVDDPARPLDGLQVWTEADRSIDGEDIVLWHAFGVAHVPRVEDFPVMPVQVTGFILEPDGYFDGNPLIDVAPAPCGASKQRVIKCAE
jgi:primary-amine oxidase